MIVSTKSLYSSTHFWYSARYPPYSRSLTAFVHNCSTMAAAQDGFDIFMSVPYAANNDSTTTGSISRAHTTSFGGRYGNFPSRICNLVFGSQAATQTRGAAATQTRGAAATQTRGAAATQTRVRRLASSFNKVRYGAQLFSSHDRGELRN